MGFELLFISVLLAQAVPVPAPEDVTIFTEKQADAFDPPPTPFLQPPYWTPSMDQATEALAAAVALEPPAFDDPTQYVWQVVGSSFGDSRIIVLNAVCRTAAGADWRSEFVTRARRQCLWQAQYSPDSDRILRSSRSLRQNEFQKLWAPVFVSPEAAGLDLPLCGLTFREVPKLTEREACLLEALRARCNEGDVCLARCILEGEGRGVAGGCHHGCFAYASGEWTAPKGAEACDTLNELPWKIGE